MSTNNIRSVIKRVIMPWHFSRVAFVLLGISFWGFAIADRLWLPALFGTYFVLKGVFAWGCASGECKIPIDEHKI